MKCSTCGFSSPTVHLFDDTIRPKMPGVVFCITCSRMFDNLDTVLNMATVLYERQLVRSDRAMEAADPDVDLRHWKSKFKQIEELGQRLIRFGDFGK